MKETALTRDGRPAEADRDDPHLSRHAWRGAGMVNHVRLKLLLAALPRRQLFALTARYNQ